MIFKAAFAALVCGAFVGACSTTKLPPSVPIPDASGTGIAVPHPSKTPAGVETPETTPPISQRDTPEISTPSTSDDLPDNRDDAISAPDNNNDDYDEMQASVFQSGFAQLPYWGKSDPSPALRAFQITCAVWKTRDPLAWISETQKAYGQYKDWQSACDAANGLELTRETAIGFFQEFFEPVIASEASAMHGLMTGYYIPLIAVKATKDSVYSEPILEKPVSLNVQSLPRHQVTDKTSTVIAYGKPIDVFFMQVQGSGRLQFPDGRIVRAAFDGHNNLRYKSIGKTLIKRGDLSRDKASKDDLIEWMIAAGPEKTRALINENPRYVYFKTEPVRKDVGPNGGMGVPLTAMGSVAVDPKFHPYGVLYWIETNLPQGEGDYKGRPSGILLSSQDTGGAIKGEARGDIFFGFGSKAGDKAGVMKHEGRWVMLLPMPLAVSQAMN